MDKDTKYVCDFQGNPTKIGNCIVYVKKIGSASKLAMGPLLELQLPLERNVLSLMGWCQTG